MDLERRFEQERDEERIGRHMAEDERERLREKLAETTKWLDDAHIALGKIHLAAIKAGPDCELKDLLQGLGL